MNTITAKQHFRLWDAALHGNSPDACAAPETGVPKRNKP
jgi:hypothetical protein